MMMMARSTTIPTPSQMRIFMSWKHSQHHTGPHGSAETAHLPPHLLANLVGAAPEALRRLRQVVGLVLQMIQASAALRDLVDVVAHHANGVVDLLTWVSLQSRNAQGIDPGTIRVASGMLVQIAVQTSHSPGVRFFNRTSCLFPGPKQLSRDASGKLNPQTCPSLDAAARLLAGGSQTGWER